MDPRIRLISPDQLYGINPPFPFGETSRQQDHRLFGDRKSTFKFEHIASEFESTDEQDSGIESELSTISPGSIASLPSPVDMDLKPINLSKVTGTAATAVAVQQEIRKPSVLSVRHGNQGDARKPFKHWKKSLTRSFLNSNDQENSQTAANSSSHSSFDRDNSTTAVLQSMNVGNCSGASVLSRARNLPVPVAPTRLSSKPRIVQPWTSPSSASSTLLPLSHQSPHWVHLPAHLTSTPTRSEVRVPPTYNRLAQSAEDAELRSPRLEPQLYQNTIFNHSETVILRKENQEHFSCQECKKSFSTQSGYAKHQQLHSSNQIQKEFSCKYCLKHYNSQSALKMHIRTHTLPCKCAECGKSFSRPWLLQGHMRTHTGEKPFSCSHCSRNFADKSNLRAHLQTHLQNKKYSCPGCHKSFSRMSLLNKHTDAGCSAVSRSGADAVVHVVSNLR